MPARRDEPSTSLLRDRTRRVFVHLPKALAGQEEPLHQMRVAGRRLRVALPLLAHKPAGRRVRRALRLLRDITRTAGASRDLDVALALLEPHLRELSPTAETRLLRRRLMSARARSRRRMAEGLMDLEIARLRKDLRRVLAAEAASVFEVFARLRAARATEGERLLQALLALADAYDPEALHRIRIQARRLRYAAEVADAVRGQGSEAAGLFKELQERLGRVRDLFVLSAWLKRQAAAAEARQQPALASAARSLESWSLEESRREHHALLLSRPVEIASRALEALGSGRTSAA